MITFYLNGYVVDYPTIKKHLYINIQKEVQKAILYCYDNNLKNILIEIDSDGVSISVA